MEETTGVRLSFETIRNIVLEIGEKIEDILQKVNKTNGIDDAIKKYVKGLKEFNRVSEKSKKINKIDKGEPQKKKRERKKGGITNFVLG